MPDIADRTKFEQELTSGLGSIFARYEAQARTNPQAVNYAQLQQEAEDELRRVLIIIYLLSLDGMNEFGTMRQDYRREYSQNYATRRARKVMTDSVTDIKGRVYKAQIRAQQLVASGASVSSTQAEFEQAVGAAFGGDNRASTIAITEITGANGNAETEFADLFNRLPKQTDSQSPIVPSEPPEPPSGNEGANLDPLYKPKLTAFWVTSVDDKVCPICKPLNNVREEPGNTSNWTEKFPSGPPAHPRCRCFLRWRLV